MADTHENLASVYVALGDLTLAITHFQKALELRPNFARAAEGLHKATLALSQPEQPSPELDPAPNSTQSDRQTLLLPKSNASRMNPTHARDLGRDIARAANFLRQHFENTIIPLLNQMHRLVIDGRSSSLADGDLQRKHRSAFQHNSELRKTLRQLCVRLFAADELSRTSSN